MQDRAHIKQYNYASLTPVFTIIYFNHMLDPLFIVILGLLGFPAVRATIRGQFRVLQSVRGVTSQMKIRILLAFVTLVITAIGVYVYIMMFSAELYVQVTCKGAGCAQGGIGLTQIVH